ncbi:MAG: hypothetical protein K2X77_04640 [Candidatus Obscuribacterales bacterium]|jgi:hypothetical protein|nr:hypothetical protein [Candidatus Obscuribacterales bacterium]
MNNKKFGRIPAQTIELFERTVADVKSKVLPALPHTAGEELKGFTLEAVLEIIFRDWHENNNTEGMREEDLADLASFVQMASALAGTTMHAQGRPIYEATLKGLLEDWLENWNKPDDPGPPGPL